MIPYRSFPATVAFVLAALVVATAILPDAALAAPTEIEIVDRTVGTGLEPKRGWFAIIRYTGWIYDEQAADKKGKRFIHSDDRGAPVSFVYGYKRALPGLEKGMEGMKVGG